MESESYILQANFHFLLSKFKPKVKPVKAVPAPHSLSTHPQRGKASLDGEPVVSPEGLWTEHGFANTDLGDHHSDALRNCQGLAPLWARCSRLQSRGDYRTSQGGCKTYMNCFK